MTEAAGAIVVAAGSSSRMGFDKLWAPLAGAPLIAWSLRTLGASPLIAELVVVTNAALVARMEELLSHLSIQAKVVPGGARRQDSVAEGLEALSDSAWALIHDGARPFITNELVERGLEAAQTTGAAIAAVPVVDTVKVVDSERIVATPDRNTLWAAQTPQVFRTSTLREAHRRSNGDATDDAAMVEAIGAEVRVFMGAYGNIKITTAVDLQLANLLAQQMTVPLS
jgi:2-C-methyl-D-erythritol 4-phosphate cytidylyltransferase